MQEKTFSYNNNNYIIRRLKAEENVIIFKIFHFTPVNKQLDLRAMFGWVDKKLVELTPRYKDNVDLLNTFHGYIIEHYQLQ